MNFKSFLKTHQVLFDGAMGTQVQLLGLPLGTVPETITLERPDDLLKIHKAYVNAGSDVISTNTFGASAYKLKETSYSVGEVVTKGISIAKKSGAKYVALDLGPVGIMMKPIGNMTFEEAYDAFKEQVEYAEGADLVLIETMSDLNEVRAAILAVKENTDLPVIVSMTFQEDGRTLTGVTPKSYVNAVEALGVDGLGVNCSLGPEQLLPIIEEITKVATVPVIVQANAGLPQVIGGKTTFSVTPKSYKIFAEKFLDLGVRIIGGCCGTGPDHIAEIRSLMGQVDFEANDKVYAVSSTSKYEAFENFVKIGERINPTGHKKLKAALKADDLSLAIREGIEQTSAGAHVLDVNVGLPDIDEEDVMKRVVDELSSVSDLPLQIDSSKSKVIEAGLRRFPGVGIINSVNGKQKSMDKIFPIAKKYGAMVICLTLDEEGIPETYEARVRIAEKMIKEAKKYGIAEERLIIDCLVLTVSAQQSQVMATIEAIRTLTTKYKVKTTLGISNVSYGMPNRPLLTRTFLSLAMQAGLSSAILDPLDDHLYNTILSMNVLLNKDVGGQDYIENIKEITASKVSKVDTVQKSDLLEMIMKGYREETLSYTVKQLETLSPIEVVNEKLIPTLDEVGLLFDKKKIFLPQLIRAAETIGVAFDEIKSRLQSNNQISKGKIVMATVYGDVHDIGKNLVKILLENYGYEIIDLGKDVPPEVVVESVLKNNIKLVGLSALMTTTVESMEKTIKLIREACKDTKVFVGGAVLTEEYSKKIDADFYCKDAKASVEVAQEVLR
ncbi:homocysteine methyltransferase [Acidaminobacter sp. JC074]|uniref:homocysteine S-methyltransferase family protein n=1 Tax=Acidaminobacter sp. JC074 TaxID=2530199 RepID=UPI001F0E3B87|nr:homocysteine S-methyltransferase family protein [Acidaminobacter sp. JC074]MCH4887205.1 homocysteine methyltransferase [Acidaminobacter sp. JC074]